MVEGLLTPVAADWNIVAGHLLRLRHFSDVEFPPDSAIWTVRDVRLRDGCSRGPIHVPVAGKPLRPKEIVGEIRSGACACWLIVCSWTFFGSKSAGLTRLLNYFDRRIFSDIHWRRGACSQLR